MGAGISQAELESRFDTEVSPEIRSQIENACRSTQEATQDLVIRDVKNSEVSGITQEALFDNSCKLSGAIEAATVAEASQELISSLQATQSTSGLFALSVQNTDIVNEIATTVSPEIINEVLSECTNAQSAKQSLTIEQIEGSSVSDILQTNQQYNDCVIDAFLKNETTAASATKATTKADVTQDTTGLDLGFGIAIAVAIVLIFGIPFFARRGGQKFDQFGQPKRPRLGTGVKVLIVLLVLAVLTLASLWILQHAGVINLLPDENAEEFNNVNSPESKEDYQIYAQ